MMSRVKHITVKAVGKVRNAKEEILFRILITVLEVLPGVIVAVETELGTPEKVAIATAVGAIISAIVNVIKQLGVVEPNSSEQEGENNA